MIEKFDWEITAGKIKDYNEEVTKNAKGSQKYQIQKQIDKTEREKDELVYKLYGITEGRKIIESENNCIID